jgi:ABC-type transport system involved in multi-copper enzyme maturation permease subunit
MTRRLAKEFRQLLPPCSVAAIAACLMAVLFPLAEQADGGAAPFFFGLSSFVFFGSIAMAAALSFGAEFQQRTLCLVASQPIPRARVWNEKLLALMMAAITAGLVLWVSRIAAGLFWSHWGVPLLPNLKRFFTAQETLLAGTCLVATLCSTGFWTLLARSTIGGLVFTLAGQFLVGLAAVYAMGRIYGPDFQFEDPLISVVILSVGVIYSGTFLWLGWRKFARLEFTDVAFGEISPLSSAVPGQRWWSDWLRCRPTGALLNLVRKELRLQKPVFMIAATFSLCWLVALALLFLQPTRQDLFETILNVLTVFDVPVAALLAGCVSLGEEKTLDLAASQLTLPIPALRLWLVKLAVSATTAIGLGLALPLFLAWITSAKASVGLVYLMHEKDNGLQLVLILSGLMFVMSFWAAAVVTNTVRAALMAVVSLPVLGGCAALGAWFGHGSGGLESSLLVLLLAHFQLPPDFLNTSVLDGWFFFVVITSVLLTALFQSLTQYRRAQPQTRAVVRCCAVLAALALLISLWCADLAVSARRLYNAPLETDLSNALRSLPTPISELPRGGSRKLTIRDLNRTGHLSHLTKVWLKGASITIHRPKGVTVEYGGIGKRSDGARVYEAFEISILFPNGGSCFFLCDLSSSGLSRDPLGGMRPSLRENNQND